jgi:adenylate cyclase
MEPNYARANAALAGTYVSSWINPLDDDYQNPVALDRAYELAIKAVQLEPTLPDAHAGLASVLIWQRQHAASIAAFEKAVALNPNFHDWRFAVALVYSGESDRAIQFLRFYMRLDPFYPPMTPHWLGIAHYMREEYMQALSALRECVSRSPHFWPVRAFLAATYAQLNLN